MAITDQSSQSPFSKNLFYLRAKAGLTQVELGELAGVTWSQISRYESDSSKPRKGVLLRLAEALDVHPEVLEKGTRIETSGGAEKFYVYPEHLGFIERFAQKNGVPAVEALNDLILKGLIATGEYNA